MTAHDVVMETVQAGRLAGKVAIITGAARGQGEAEAQLFAAEGARLVLTDILEKQVGEVAADFGEAAIGIGHDVSETDLWPSVTATVPTARPDATGRTGRRHRRDGPLSRE